MIQKRYSLVQLCSDSSAQWAVATYWGVGPIGDFVVILPTYLFDPSKISKIELDFKLNRKPSVKLLSTLYCTYFQSRHAVPGPDKEL